MFLLGPTEMNLFLKQKQESSAAPKKTRVEDEETSASLVAAKDVGTAAAI